MRDRIVGLYRRYQEHMPYDMRERIDGWIADGAEEVIIGDVIEYACEHRLMTDADRREASSILDAGILRPVAPYFRKLLAA